MDMTQAVYWEQQQENPAGINNGHHRIKYEQGAEEVLMMAKTKEERGVSSSSSYHHQCCENTNLNFSTATCSEDDSEYGTYKKSKVTRQDPMSHRIIEKRRRDRMNNCLADLSRLIPAEYLKKGRGRIEKTEIIEMAIKHMKCLQQEQGNSTEHYRMGYQECMSEAMRFMVEVEGHFPREGVCLGILNHLQKHCAETLCRMSTAAPLRGTTPDLKNTQIQIVPPSSALVLSPSREIVDYHHPVQSNPILKDKIVLAKEESLNNNSATEENYNNPRVIQTTNGDSNNNSLNGNASLNGHQNSGNNSYKYKTNIKMRFTQDATLSNGETSDCNNKNLHHVSKRQKVEHCRRSSVTSLENQSSSPSSSEMTHNRMSSVENNIHNNDNSRISPLTTESISPLTHRQLKVEPSKIHYANGHQMIAECGDDKILDDNGETKNVINNFSVPIFVLHAKGSFYVPLSIDYKTLLPYLRGYDILELGPSNNNRHPVLHPVTINVNFQPPVANVHFNGRSSYKVEACNNWR